MISRRLKSIAGLVCSEDKIIDVGCDHALLDIYLIKQKIVDTIIVSDSNKNALNNGIKNISKHKLTKKIDARLGYGIEVADESLDTVIISGMGTGTIIKILSHPNLKYFKKLIIQANNEHYLLRRFVTLKGYYIAHESVVYDKGRYYINIVFNKGQKKYSNKELFYGPILMYANKDYYEYLLKKQLAILNNVPWYRIITKLKHGKEAIYLKRLSK